MIIFLLSLTNSIFVNQVGYFGSLLLLLFKYFITKENPFEKSGLELVFVWFILAELISGLLSINQAYALNNLIKRVLLIPVVYVTLASFKDFKTGKKYFWIYIVASLVTSLVYIYSAYDAYKHGVYGLEGAGSSFFQYPITASEIISFSVVFLFAFLINEKVNWKYKFLLLIATIIAAISLIATYKRTGWIGTAFGIFIILLIKKEWKIIIPGIVLVIVLFFLQEDVSRVFIYNYDDSKISYVNTIETDGRASGIFPTDSGFILSDYENGLVAYKDTSVIKKLILQAPVVNYFTWKENYFIAHLIDTRLILLKNEKPEEWKIKDEFVTPGYTVKTIVNNGKLYVLDPDSGLTVFNNPENLTDSTRYPEIIKYNSFYVDSDFAVFSLNQRLTVFSLDEGELSNQIYDSTLSKDVTKIYYNNSKILLSSNKSLKLYRVNSEGITLVDSTNEVKGVYLFQESKQKLFALGSPPALYELSIGNDKIELLSKSSLDFFPQSIDYSNGKIYFTYVERSKLNSIWDPYIPSNFVRLSLWRVGWEIFKDYPLFGVGDINMGEYQKKYRNYYEKEIHGHLHNNFIHVLASLGLFGFLAVCFMLMKMYFINYRVFKEHKGREFISSFSLGVIGALSAFIVSGLTELNIWDHEIITLVYFTFALNVALNRCIKNES